jgi:DMSO/TMAO reductase YedYZ heme-binding membrane subunit
VREPLLYAGAFAVLMAWRVRNWRRAARRAVRADAPGDAVSAER